MNSPFDEPEVHRSAPLFREQVVEARSDRLFGAVVLRLPWTAHAIAVLIASTLCAAGIWFAFGTYARVETAPGLLVTERPTSKIFAPRGGVTTELLVKEGDTVSLGQRLIVVDADLRGANGSSAAQAGLTSIDRQLDLSQSQIALTGEIYELERLRLRENLENGATQLASLREQRDVQAELVSSQTRLFEQLEAVVERGFVSRNEYERRRQSLLSAQQSLLSLEREIMSLGGRLGEARLQLRSIEVSRTRDVAGMNASAQIVERQGFELEAARSFTLSSPIEGRVAALQTAPGQYVQANVPAMILIPNGADLIAEIYAPTRAIGFVHLGQSVSLQIDAFPYQRFGTVRGNVKSVSQIILDPRETSVPFQLTEPVYRVRVQITDGVDGLRDRSIQLQPGMTLTASIVLERQTFLEWLLTPLRAVDRRV